MKIYGHLESMGIEVTSKRVQNANVKVHSAVRSLLGGICMDLDSRPRAVTTSRVLVRSV